MENQNPDANQLPEVDSLPDGFVDSSREPLASSAPNFEQEKPDCPNFGDGKENISEIDCPSEHVHRVSTKEFVKSHNETENTPELKIFPVSFSEKDNFDGSEGLVEMPIKGHVDQAEGMLVTPVSGDSVSEASVRVSECCEVKERAEVKCQHSERLIEEGSGAQTTNMKESSFLEGTDEMKNGKNETAEIKRKNVKRTFKSEREFLEFTLKYRQVIAERDSAIVVRDKLESLCRELHRQNKVLMDECKRVSKEGQTFRLDLSARFQDAIKDVSYKLEEQKNECISQLKENEMLRSKLKELADQYALSEQQFVQKLKQKTLELQIAHLKIKQHEEKLVQEQSQMKLYAEQVSQLLQTEKNLRLQLTADGEKFQQFQEALAKSNEVFETFKQEIEKMTKSMKELKKENLFLKSKTEDSDVTLILVDECERLKKQLEKTNNQKEKLESSYRSLQAERKQNSAGSNNSESGMNT